MSFIALKSFLCFIVLSIFCDTIHGKGSFYISTYTDRYTGHGIRIVYRPSHKAPSYWGDYAYIAFYELNSEYGRDEYDEKINLTSYEYWKGMQPQRDYSQKYWCMDDDESSTEVTTGKWFGYAVHIFIHGTLIHQDEYNFYQVPPYVSYCTLDTYTSYSTSPPNYYTCSQALEGKAPPTYQVKGIANESQGQLYLSPLYDTGEGLRIVYRPNASLLRGDPEEAWVGYYLLSSESERADYEEKVISTKYYRWESLRKPRYEDYFYFDNYHREAFVTTGNWFGYAVHIFDASEHLIHKDEYNFYQVPSSVSYCTVSFNDRWTTYNCDQALDGELPSPTTTQGDDESARSAAKQKGIIAAAVIIPVGAVIIVVILCIKCKKVPETSPATESYTLQKTQPENANTDTAK